MGPLHNHCIIERLVYFAYCILCSGNEKSSKKFRDFLNIYLLGHVQ